jgi:hypothetical protein
MMTPFTPAYFINHCEGLGAANVEFRDLWDTNQRPLLRNRAMQTEAKVDPGYQFLTSYNDLGRIADGAKLAPDVKEVSDTDTVDYNDDPDVKEVSDAETEEKAKDKKEAKKKKAKDKKKAKKRKDRTDVDKTKEDTPGEDEDEELDPVPAPEDKENAKDKKKAKKRKVDSHAEEQPAPRGRVQRNAAKHASAAISRLVAQETTE